MKLAVLSSAALFLAAPPSMALSSVTDVTDLSSRAANIETGMSKCAIHALLGRPTWVIGVGEDEEIADLPVSEWAWDNGQCDPVTVMFREPEGTVSGWSEGRAFCAETAEQMPFKPEDRFRLDADVPIDCD